MNFIKIPTPNDGYCAFHAFSFSLLVLIKYRELKIPHGIYNKLMGLLKNEKIQAPFSNDSACNFEFISKYFALTKDEFYSKYISNIPFRHKSLYELIKSASTLEELYAISYCLSAVFVHLSKFQKYQPSDIYLSKIAYQVDINLLSGNAIFEHFLLYHHNINGKQIHVLWDEGHFESIIEPTDEIKNWFTAKNIYLEQVDTAKYKLHDGSLFNYLTKARSVLAENKSTLFYYSASAIALGTAVAYEMYANNQQSNL